MKTYFKYRKNYNELGVLPIKNTAENIFSGDKNNCFFVYLMPVPINGIGALP